jgi:hypothetical protein
MTVPLSVLDPYTESYSHLLDFNYLRPKSGIEMAPFEEYIVLLISEFDKEYSSNDSNIKALVNDDGVHITFGTISHWIRRHAKVFIDYQIITQVPLRLRGNAEKFIYIEDYRYKMPFLLNLYSIPFKILYSWIDQILNQYKYYKQRLTKDSLRKSKRTRKRYDYTFLYAFFKFSLHYLDRVLQWFSKFTYVKFYISFTDRDGKKLKKSKVLVNTVDEQYKGSRLYESVFLSKSYDEKKAAAKKLGKQSTWDKLGTYSSLDPSIEELVTLNSRFLNASLNIDTPETDSITKKQGVDIQDEEETKAFEF